jgi:hypothetical protein
MVAKILDQLSVSAWLPAGVLIFGLLLLGSIRAGDGSVHDALKDLAHLSASSLILLFVAAILATVLT